MTFQLLLAGKIVEIKSNYDAVYNFCRRYLIKNSINEKPDIIVRITNEDIEEELLNLRSDTMQLRRSNSDSTVFMPEHIETTIVNKKIADAMMSFGILLIHGSVVSTDKRGFMFTAPKGVGKTTRTKVWIDNIPNSYVINGDKPLVKISSDGVFAYGTPWCGKEGMNCNAAVPLQAVFLVERADTDGFGEIVIDELPISKAISAFVPQIYCPNQIGKLSTIFELLKVMGTYTKFYRFKSDPTAEAIKSAYGRVCSTIDEGKQLLTSPMV